jgi:hypothetical protein
MNKFYVYVYVDGNDIPLYVGKGCGDRDQKHLYSCRLDDGSYWHNKLKKLLRENKIFRVIKLFNDLSEDQAYAWERGLIDYYGRKDNATGILYNLTDGGVGSSGSIMSHENIERNRELMRERMRILNTDPDWAAANSERCRARMLDLHTRPEFLATKAEILKVFNTDPKVKAAKVERLRVLNADPAFIAAKVERLRLLHSDSEFMTFLSDSLRAYNADPIVKARKSEQFKTLNADPIFAAENAKRSSERIRKRWEMSRVIAFGQLWYKVDLAKKFGIKYATFSQRISKLGYSPTWACLWNSHKPIPDYCKPSKIPIIFGERPSAEAFDYMHTNNYFEDSYA